MKTWDVSCNHWVVLMCLSLLSNNHRAVRGLPIPFVLTYRVQKGNRKPEVSSCHFQCKQLEILQGVSSQNSTHFLHSHRWFMGTVSIQVNKKRIVCGNHVSCNTCVHRCVASAGPELPLQREMFRGCMWLCVCQQSGPREQENTMQAPFQHPPPL